ncbi:hypothetical protein [Viridibacillus arvi]|uniref:Uncharacterized protein n=1 Tax=Viridibacillus arvi TaxID=263475 RepID=A0A0M0LCQ9_9BACL|nr:hypothetical protein [Viridibacillus arvi]KOO48771.1 hypothetical protein AMD00_10085 [Viridibacillus arvi]
MKHESDKLNEVKVLDSNITFEQIYKSEYFPIELEEELKKCDVLLIPTLVERNEDEHYVFPEQTMNFYDYAKGFLEKEHISADICISDKDYKEFELHSIVETIATIIVNNVAFPFTINMISSYLYEKITNRNNINKKIKVNFEVVDGKKAKKIAYEGDASSFKETMEAIKIFEE